MERKVETTIVYGEVYWGLGSRQSTLPETNMETQKGPYTDYSPSKRGLHGFPCKFGG